MHIHINNNYITNVFLQFTITIKRINNNILYPIVNVNYYPKYLIDFYIFRQLMPSILGKVKTMLV